MNLLLSNWLTVRCTSVGRGPSVKANSSEINHLLCFRPLAWALSYTNISFVVIILPLLGGGQCPHSWLGNQSLPGLGIFVHQYAWLANTSKLDWVQSPMLHHCSLNQATDTAFLTEDINTNRTVLSPVPRVWKGFTAHHSPIANNQPTLKSLSFSPCYQAGYFYQYSNQ